MRALAATLLALALPAGAADLTLSQAVGRALEANRALLSASLAAQGERESLAAARADFELKIIPTGSFGRLGSNLLDGGAYGANASVGARVSRKFETGTVVSMGPSFNRSGSERNTTMNVSVSQPLFKGWDAATTTDGVRRAEFSVSSAERARRQSQVNVALEAIGAYYEVEKLTRAVDFSRAQDERLRRHLQLARSKERTGLIDSMDLYRAEIRLRDAEDAANRARHALAAAEDRLRLVLDLPMSAPLQLAPPPPPDAAIPDAEDAALERRQEIVQLREEYAEAVRQASLAAKAIAPDVTVQLNYGTVWSADPFVQSYVPTTQRQWSLNLQASTDLDRTAEKAALRRAELRVESARLALDGKVADVRRQVRLQRLAVEEAGARITLRREQIRQAGGKLALAELKFVHDMASNLDVLDAETELARAQESLRDAEVEHALGVYNLRALAGRLLESFGQIARGAE